MIAVFSLSIARAPGVVSLSFANTFVLLPPAAPNSISVSEDTKLGKGVGKVISRPVTGSYLSVMGIRPYLGRLLTPEDEDSKTKVAVLTYTCWQRL